MNVYKDARDAKDAKERRRGLRVQMVTKLTDWILRNKEDLIRNPRTVTELGREFHKATGTLATQYSVKEVLETLRVPIKIRGASRVAGDTPRIERVIQEMCVLNERLHTVVKCLNDRDGTWVLGSSEDYAITPELTALRQRKRAPKDIVDK